MRDDYWPPDDDEEGSLPVIEVQQVVPAGSIQVGRSVGLQYWEMYRYVFRSSHWGMNLLAGAVCLLVPVVGPLVFLGYGYELIEALHRWGGRRYPDFDTGRLAPYLMRGLWPFLISLIIGLIGLFVIILLIGVPVAVAVAVVSKSEGPGVFVAIGVVAFLAFMGLTLLLQMFATPLVLRAGLRQELDFSNALGFTREFVRRTWKEMLLAWLFLTFTGMGLVLLGFLLCYIGIYAVQPLLTLAHLHLLYQLYQVYLVRGGTPIPFKPASTD